MCTAAAAVTFFMYSPSLGVVGNKSCPGQAARLSLHLGWILVALLLHPWRQSHSWKMSPEMSPEQSDLSPVWNPVFPVSGSKVGSQLERSGFMLEDPNVCQFWLCGGC